MGLNNFQVKIFSRVDFFLFLKYFFGYLLLVLPFAVLIIDGRALLAEAAWQMKDKFDSLSLPKLAERATTSRAFAQATASSTQESYVYIPKIKTKAPIVFPDTSDPNKLLKWLEKGVIHYPDSAMFGDPPAGGGVAILLGHSSAYPWFKGDYGSVFALLEKLQAGDEVIVVSNGKKYLYRVSGSKVVVPKDFRVENPEGKSQLWLMSCWPVKTNKLRIVVATDLISTENL